MTTLERIDEDPQQEESHERGLFHDLLINSDPIAPRWTLNDFDIGKRLGEGQYGAVYLARERRTGYLVALKVIKKTQLLNTYNEHLLRREIEIHSHLIHPNILGFYGWFVTEIYIFLILEIAPKGELMDFLVQGGLSESTVSKYMMQMISAIRCCHRLNVMHRDLKPENILVDMEGNLKLADFGWAAHVATDAENANKTSQENVKSPAQQSAAQRNLTYMKARRKTYCGTLDYLSPEICRHDWYGKEVDLWCLGVLAYELATGGPPFPHNNYIAKGLREEEARKRQQEDIQKSDIESRLVPTMSAELRDFLRKTLAKEPRDRMTTTQMIHHPFITKYNDIQAEMDAELMFDRGGGSAGSFVPVKPKSVIATPAPGMTNQDAPLWQFSRHYLSAASSPNSGPLASGPTSPFPFIKSQNSDTPPYQSMFAPPITAGRQQGLMGTNHLSTALLQDGRNEASNGPFKIVKL
eukprot:Blabericola_migrator_1__12938@NODE_853_length_6253_cov_534_155512_g604_i0_p3_GENE_NODE_853_length_6253_cov_534_155512_g604_i0NODE_853_length_6253_cov_534_155512_g604_i0_p3_ORF_typecomplete_len467_score83_53Pkinase/PF00069_25/1_1e70Pkinase_Tyr/PF07714_17/1_7e43Kinaselike/PF14531_6/1_7e14Kdo/PF06293_14/3_4e08Pkinase_fungal/PF17667_1/1_1e02Pkinase_fungal/PF17667_1/2_2e06FTA2/PF13095_6/3_8FTA2/PF13095_6/0_0064WaaY/PF06176_11/0_00014RIO1/PF01163_22/0_0004APH/PF01636_23/0_0056APH/PF01636_23/1_7e03YrbL